VVVFDNFPATKVKDWLQMVNGGHGRDKASSNTAPQNLPTPSHNLSGTSLKLLEKFLVRANHSELIHMDIVSDNKVSALQTYRWQGGSRSTGFSRGERAGNRVAFGIAKQKKKLLLELAVASGL